MRFKVAAEESSSPDLYQVQLSNKWHACVLRNTGCLGAVRNRAAKGAKSNDILQLPSHARGALWQAKLDLEKFGQDAQHRAQRMRRDDAQALAHAFVIDRP